MPTDDDDRAQQNDDRYCAKPTAHQKAALALGKRCRIGCHVSLS
jgi:hypothetical protein